MERWQDGTAVDMVAELAEVLSARVVRPGSVCDPLVSFGPCPSRRDTACVRRPPAVRSCLRSTTTRGNQDRAYYDRVTGERLEVVSKLVPLSSSPSNLPRSPRRPDLPALRGARRARSERLPLLSRAACGAIGDGPRLTPGILTSCAGSRSSHRRYRHRPRSSARWSPDADGRLTAAGGHDAGADRSERFLQLAIAGHRQRDNRREEPPASPAAGAPPAAGPQPSRLRAAAPRRPRGHPAERRRRRRRAAPRKVREVLRAEPRRLLAVYQGAAAVATYRLRHRRIGRRSGVGHHAAPVQQPGGPVETAVLPHGARLERARRCACSNGRSARGSGSRVCCNAPSSGLPARTFAVGVERRPRKPEPR